MLFTKYDFLTAFELKQEATKRFGTNKGKKPALIINRNQAGYKYRLLLVQDDLKNGKDPYVKFETNEGNKLS